jgi:hypothetical protein
MAPRLGWVNLKQMTDALCVRLNEGVLEEGDGQVDVVGLAAAERYAN